MCSLCVSGSVAGYVNGDRCEIVSRQIGERICISMVVALGTKNDVTARGVTNLQR